MSRVSTANSVAVRSASNAMQLPNIPRLTSDEKSRSKYISEYEKFEPELRRHHIGTAETTSTIGLKDVPAEFDRTVPSITEPTRAEIEFERQHPGRARSAAKLGQGGGTPPPPSQTAGEAAANTAKMGTTAMSPLAAAAAAKRNAAHSNPPPPRQQRGMMMVQDRPTSMQSTSMSGPLSNVEMQSFLAVVAAPEAAEKPIPADAAGAAATTTTATTAAAPLPPAEGGAVTSAKPGSAAARHPRFPAAAPHPSMLKKPAAETKPAMSLPRMRSAPPLNKPLAATQPGVRTHDKPKSVERSATARRVPHTFSPPPPQQQPQQPQQQTTAESTARLLCVLLEPPPQYLTSLDLDFSSIDLDWMRTGAAPPRHFNTIANFNDAASSAGAPAKLNSPRSVLTLLEHGVSLKDWDASSAAADGGGVNGIILPPELAGQSTRLHAELQQHRRTHAQEQRRAMRAELEKSYQTLCAKVPLDDLINLYRQARHAALHPDAGISEDEKAVLSTAVRQRQERQRRVFETNKMRMVRQIEQAKELHARQEAAERRQHQAETEAEQERRQRAAEEETARRQQQERAEARRAEREQREEAVRVELQGRMAKADARNAERAAARERQQKALQQEREAQAAERARRLERNTAVLEAQASQMEEKRLQKEQKVEEMRLAREARLAEEHRQQVEKQQRAALQRDEARQRAAEAEEAVRAAAVERQQQAEARLQEFYARRHEEALQRAAAEAEHRKRLDDARAEAYAKEEMFKTAIQEKLQQHEDRYHDTRMRQLADLAWRREAEREEQEEKAYAVLQLHRMAEFNKLHTVADLLEKRRAANAITRQRELVCEQAMRDRDKLRQERNALKQQLAKGAP